ncbi:RagB/SusD family nutrient uptake outer membrane protein [Algoriphagus chordae]|uniref:SusD-like starch-binding protein associating with outer membrane n=1 Tax=Algoriphagus chordae TaxID=237019 RepID=A0A2W7QTQ3_9BACT|nr:RagB/SusD family nutrient uptake outer membrane protein [Algoriphagus chordae]PZX51983.1 SusD-like starch-binding protein associating with outer membrane [Algoriphagus chordae]
MKKLTIKTSVLAIAAAFFTSCNPFHIDEIQDPNNPSVESVSNNATQQQIQFLVTGLESRHRGYVSNVTRAWGTFGREIWNLNASDPRNQTDWLGQNGRVPDRSYFGFGNTGGGSWATPYQAIKQADVLIVAGENTENISVESKSAVIGFAKTIQGFQFMIPANWVYSNGIRVDVKDPLNPGPFVPYDQALAAIKGILDEGDQALQAAGSGDFPFTLTSGFEDFNTIPKLRQVNRAITARLDAYRKDWQGVLTALDASFMDMNGDLNAGPAHPYGAAPDVFNPIYYVPNAPVNSIIVVHPSMLDDATPNDKRVAEKFFKRDEPVLVTTDAGALVGEYQDGRWESNTDPIPFIRNEELILLKAEAHAQLDQTSEAVAAINVIRTAAGIGSYAGSTSKDALIDEILYQRRYSLWAEPWGHRWIDARRYDRLGEIDTSYDSGTIFTEFPHPQAELSWDEYKGD